LKKQLSRLAAFALLGAAPLLSAQMALAAPKAPAAPKATTCPAPVPEAARCYTGEDGTGALYWIAIPKDWNRGVLVMHAHGGPETGPPKLERSEEDLKRWAVTVKAGYAWAGSTYRRGWPKWRTKIWRRRSVSSADMVTP
jgi:hypothetical protein